MTVDEIRDELIAGLDRAAALWKEQGITDVQPVHDDPACICTVQYRSPEDVHMIVRFSCPRHHEGAQELHRLHTEETP